MILIKVIILIITVIYHHYHCYFTWLFLNAVLTFSSLYILFILIHSNTFIKPSAKWKHTYFTIHNRRFIFTNHSLEHTTLQLISYPYYAQNKTTTRLKFLNQYSSFENFYCFHSFISWTVWVNTWNKWTVICSPESHRGN